jgi:membrane-associated phospholipid phosphatase
MNGLIVGVAQYLLFALVVVVAVVWLTLDRPGKGRFVLQAVVGLVAVGIGLWLAGHLHTDPRPFVQNAAIKPLFAHSRSDGFPSDHSAAAGLLTVLVARYRRVLGAVVAGCAAAIAWARVAAHVHHLQDVVAGLAIGAVAGLLGLWLGSLLWSAYGRQLTRFVPALGRR